MYEDAEVPDGVELYDMEDYDTHRKLIFDTAKNTLIKQYPKVYKGVRMELTDVDYRDPDYYPIKVQKDALLNNKYLTRRLAGTIRLVDDSTNEVLDQKTQTLMKVPYMTNRGTFIRDGNEWVTISQARLLPGGYTRRQANNDLETQFNVRPGTGRAFRLGFSPETASYKIHIAGSDIHLYSLLKDLGTSDDVIDSRWGPEVAELNRAKYDKGALDKAYNKLVPEWDRKENGNRSREDKAKLVKGALDRSQVATNVVRTTLPSMFSMDKSASLHQSIEAMRKVSSLNTYETKELAKYISQNIPNTYIDASNTKTAIEDDIRKLIGIDSSANTNNILKAVETYTKNIQTNGY